MTFSNLYKNNVIGKPKFTLLILILILVSFGYFAKSFQLDASSDTLLLENDPDLKYLREVNSKYGSKDFLVLTYTPKDELLSSDTIKNLRELKNDLSNLEWSSNVITILDVPLLKNNDEPLAERIKNYKTLSSKDVNLKRGYDEIINSPIYKNFVISEDGKTTGIIVYINPDKKLSEFIKRKNDYLNKKYNSELSSEEKKEFKKFSKEYDLYKKLYNQRNHQNILEIRSLINQYQNMLHLLKAVFEKKQLLQRIYFMIWEHFQLSHLIVKQWVV